ncbi:hypothetical protein UlMin_034928 [Ulmus minor]
MALIAKNKLSFVDGTFSEITPDDELYAFWYRCNSMVMSWLLHAVSNEIVDSIMYINNAVDAWHDFHDRFYQRNEPRAFQIKQLLNGLAQGFDDDFRLIHACSCGGMKALLDYQQHEYVMQFLMGLNESYTQIRAQILMQDPLPSINNVFSLVVQEERQRSLTHLSNDSVACNAAFASGFYGQYPPGFKFKPRPPFTNSKPVVNQIDITCDQPNVAASSENVSNHVSGFNSTLSSSTLSSSQCQQLIALLSSQQ